MIIHGLVHTHKHTHTHTQRLMPQRQRVSPTLSTGGSPTRGLPHLSPPGTHLSLTWGAAPACCRLVSVTQVEPTHGAGGPAGPLTVRPVCVRGQLGCKSQIMIERLARFTWGWTWAEVNPRADSWATLWSTPLIGRGVGRHALKYYLPWRQVEENQKRKNKKNFLAVLQEWHR